MSESKSNPEKGKDAEVKTDKTEICGIIGCKEIATIAVRVLTERTAKLAKLGFQMKPKGKQVYLCENHRKLTEGPSEEKTKDFKPCGVLDNGTVFESIYLDKKPCFLCYDGKKFYTEDSVSVGDVKYLPAVTEEQVPYRPYRFSQADIDHYNTSPPISGLMLYEKIKKEFDTFVSAEDYAIRLLSIVTMESYVQHLESSVAYLNIFGDKGSGKTRILEVEEGIGFRPMLCLGAPSADVFRYLGFHGKGNGMILEDEGEKMEGDIDKMKIYRSGYRKSGRTPRIEEFHGKYVQRYYPTYCTKFFDSIDGINEEEPTRDRCIDIQMIKSQPVKDEITDEDSMEEGVPLTPEYVDTLRFDLIKKELLIWRMQNYHKHLPSVPNMIFTGRFKELWKGKLRVAYFIGPAVFEELNKQALLLWNESEENVKTSMNADLTKACMIAYLGAGRKDIYLKDVWGVFQWVVGVTPNNNAKTIDVENYGSISLIWISKILRNEFGFKTKQMARGKLVQVKEAEGKFAKILKKYRIKTDEVIALTKKYEEGLFASAGTIVKGADDIFKGALKDATAQEGANKIFGITMIPKKDKEKLSAGTKNADEDEAEYPFGKPVKTATEDTSGDASNVAPSE